MSRILASAHSQIAAPMISENFLDVLILSKQRIMTDIPLWSSSTLSF